jgi:TonB family protein
VRWDSPFVLAVAGTIAIHVILVTASDAIVVTHPPGRWVAPPHVELVEVEVPPVVAPPPPPVVPPEPAPAPEVKPAPRPRAVRAATAPLPRAAEPPPADKTEAPEPSGGDPVVHMDDIAPAATGVGVATGKRTTGHVGRGGAGGGTGAGSGEGSAEIARPVSVAMIKTDALPKGDYSYFGAGKDYPAEAKALGIEGAIKVALVVDERGRVVSRKLVNKLGHGLDELAMERAAKLEFVPAKDTDDKPVVSQLTWTFTFTLPR